MSGRNWLLHPPVVAGIAIVALLGWAGLIDQKREAERAYSASKQKYEDTRGIAPIVKPPQSAQTDPKSYRDEWRSEQDLEAQWQMAKWALWMFITTTAGVVVTAAGVYYVAQTLRLNRDLLVEADKTSKAAITSAEAALATVNESKRAADASAEGVVIARESLIAQQRPWLRLTFEIEKVEYVGAMIDVTIKAKVRNAGNSPAFYSLLGSSFRQGGSTEKREGTSLEEASMFASAVKETHFVVVHDESATHTISAREPDMLGTSVEIAFAVHYRMPGYDKVFESACVGTVKFPDSKVRGGRIVGEYHGRVEFDAPIMNYLT